VQILKKLTKIILVGKEQLTYRVIARKIGWVLKAEIKEIWKTSKKASMNVQVEVLNI
jgi:hypothetical protein